MRIIRVYAHMWPREIFDERSKQGQLLASTIEFLQKEGVYILYRNEQPYYIGKTIRRTLFRRLRAHANKPTDKYYHFWTHFSAFAVEKPEFRDELEGILIAAMPTANSASPKLQKEQVPKSVASLMRRMRRAKLGLVT